MTSKKETKLNKTTPKKVLDKGSKKIPVKVVVSSEDKEDEGDILSEKSGIKKPIEIDAADILPEVEEKIDEDSALLALEDDESEDGPSLDAEDLNPFGDKWEI